MSFVCGNGSREGSEECDDGNLVNGDGCNNSCQIEYPYCGDHVIETRIGETCEPSLTPPTEICDPITCTLRTSSAASKTGGYCCFNGGCYQSTTCTMKQYQCQVYCAASSAASGYACAGDECARGGEAYCASSGQSCVATAGRPCVRCVGGGSSTGGASSTTFVGGTGGIYGGTSGTSGGECASDAQCTDGQHCIGGFCIAQCRTDDHCPAGQRCIQGKCLSVLQIGSLPAFCGNARTDFGEQCDDGALNGTAGDPCDAQCRSARAAPDVLPGTSIQLPFTPTVEQTSGRNPANTVIGSVIAPATPNPPSNASSGPATLAVMAAGASAGYAFMRRRKKL